MLSKLLALSSVGLASAASTGSVTGLCASLIAGPCAAYSFNGLTPTQQNCEDLFAIYTNATGPNWQLGMDDQKTGNTIGCRQYYANMAASTNQSSWCQYAGISGGGMCGSMVDNACDHVSQACLMSATAPYATAALCKTAYTGIAAQWGSKQGQAAQGEDSLECRIYHSLVAFNWGTFLGGAQGTDFHCPHALATSATCNGAITTNKQHHCDTIMNACTGSKQQYNTHADCMASVGAFPNTLNDARAANAANDQGCRQYHAQAAASGVGDIHCTHGGPSGQYVCGGANGTRDSWRYIANNAACQADANSSIFGQAITAAFNTWAFDDILKVMPTPTGQNYTVAAAGDNDFCRIYHCTVASVGGAALSHCEHCAIAPMTECFDTGVPPGIAPICRIALAACPSSFASVTACITALGPVAQSKPGNSRTLSPPATDTFACRAYQASVALATKKMGASNAANCANVAVAAGPLCGGSAKSDAATLFVSAAVVLPFLLM